MTGDVRGREPGRRARNPGQGGTSFL